MQNRSLKVDWGPRVVRISGTDAAIRRLLLDAVAGANHINAGALGQERIDSMRRSTEYGELNLQMYDAYDQRTAELRERGI